ncbi:hypothetical protein A9267_12745 [Shewanella sp. UCD-FRSSP16_17]|uniref:hypothetical protein n=1 Tax=Shewanella sp. UCD-FRSSP16_17 TaxID=1853256 RepID=UPI0007EEC9EF|nr:hypothetical protein [Shewanella sp. UCD-FRSSP16_17]OBT06768.1 hypothetical protein A9267_12745 [Shewanella sp. UCD-FRSSP16_17]
MNRQLTPAQRMMITQKRVIVLVLIILGVFGLLGYRAAVVTMGMENATSTNLMLVTRTPNSLTKLQEHSDKMNLMINDIESLPLKDIRSTITKTVALINLTTREIDAQYEAWVDLKAKMDDDGVTFRELKKNLDTIKTLQGEEIISLKKTLDDVNNDDVSVQFISLLISFIVGILSSTVASLLYPSIKDKAKSAIDWIVKS